MAEYQTTQMADNLQLSGLVLCGSSQLMVGLSNSQWLRIPLAAIPALQGLSEEEWLDYRLLSNNTALRWPGRSISLTLHELANHAISMDDGSTGPD